MLGHLTFLTDNFNQMLLACARKWSNKQFFYWSQRWLQMHEQSELKLTDKSMILRNKYGLAMSLCLVLLSLTLSTWTSNTICAIFTLLMNIGFKFSKINKYMKYSLTRWIWWCLGLNIGDRVKMNSQLSLTYNNSHSVFSSGQKG